MAKSGYRGLFAAVAAVFARAEKVRWISREGEENPDDHLRRALVYAKGRQQGLKLRAGGGNDLGVRAGPWSCSGKVSGSFLGKPRLATASDTDQKICREETPAVGECRLRIKLQAHGPTSTKVMMTGMSLSPNRPPGRKSQRRLLGSDPPNAPTTPPMGKPWRGTRASERRSPPRLLTARLRPHLGPEAEAHSGQNAAPKTMPRPIWRRPTRTQKTGMSSRELFKRAGAWWMSKVWGIAGTDALAPALLTIKGSP